MKLCVVACLIVQLMHIHGLNIFDLGSSSSSSTPSSSSDDSISISFSDLKSSSSSSCSSSSSEGNAMGGGGTGGDGGGDGGNGGGDGGGNGGQDNGPALVGGDCSGCGSCVDPNAICVPFGCFNICMCAPGFSFKHRDDVGDVFKCGKCEECLCSTDDDCTCADDHVCINDQCVPECTGCEVRVPGGGCMELGHGDDCSQFPPGACASCRVDLACVNNTCQCVNDNLQNDVDENMCLGDDLGEPCDNDDETDPCHSKNDRTECDDVEDNPVCVCSPQYEEKDDICCENCVDGKICCENEEGCSNVGPGGCYCVNGEKPDGSGCCPDACDDDQVCNDDGVCEDGIPPGGECGRSANSCQRDLGIKCEKLDCCGEPEWPACSKKFCICETDHKFRWDEGSEACEHTNEKPSDLKKICESAFGPRTNLIE